MAKTAAQRQREYRERQKARQAAASEAPQAAPEPSAGIIRRPLAEPGICGLFQDGAVITIADGAFAYSATLSPNEMLGLGMRLLQAVGVRVELTAPDADRPRPLPASTPIGLLKAAGNA